MKPESVFKIRTLLEWCSFSVAEIVCKKKEQVAFVTTTSVLFDDGVNIVSVYFWVYRYIFISLLSWVYL